MFKLLIIGWLALITAASLTCLNQVQAAPEQSPVPPHIFAGTVHQYGELAPQGTQVWAITYGQVKGKSQVKENGRFHIKVDKGQSRDIWFIIGNRRANETTYWEQGGVTVLNLTVGKQEEQDDCHGEH